MARLIGKTEDGRDIYGMDFDIEVKECKQTDDGKRIISMIGSTPSVDRDGDTIRQQGWDLKAYKKNSVVLWGHNHDIPAIGRANKVKKSSEALNFEELEFPKEGIHLFADMIYSLIEAKFIKAGSVGFIPTDMESRNREDDEPDIGWCPMNFKKQELLEFSIVNVGSNREALVTHLGAKGFKTMGKVKIDDQEFDLKQLINAIFAEEKEDKTVIRFKHYPLADEDTTWSGPKEIREADVAQLKKMSTWFDSEDPDVKASYKLPHHQANDLHTVWNGVRAAMGALLGARGGVDVPEEDRKGIFSHLSRHYIEFDKDVPEFKAYSEPELKEMFPELFEEKDAKTCGGCSDFGCDGNQCDSPHKDQNGKEVNPATIACEHYCEIIEEIPFKAASKGKEIEDLVADDIASDKGFVDYIVSTIRSIEAIERATGLSPEKSKELLGALEKAGAVLSRANKNKLKGAAQAITEVLASAEPAEEDGGHSTDDKTKPPEEVDLKQVLDKLAGLEVTVGKLSEQVQTKKPADDEVDLDKLKVPNQNEINLEELELPQEKDEVDVEMLSKVLQELKREQLAKFSEVIKGEIRKATGRVD